jgi:hypothetical protein
MSALSAFILLASVSSGTATGYLRPLVNPTMLPAFQEAPKGPNGLTLYDEKGEVVARCDRTDDKYGNCKIEPGFSLDDLMNAWVHAYQEMQK